MDDLTRPPCVIYRRYESERCSDKRRGGVGAEQSALRNMRGAVATSRDAVDARVSIRSDAHLEQACLAYRP